MSDDRPDGEHDGDLLFVYRKGYKGDGAAYNSVNIPGLRAVTEHGMELQRQRDAAQLASLTAERDGLRAKVEKVTAERDFLADRLWQVATLAHDKDDDSHEKRSGRLGQCSGLAFDREARELLCRKDMRVRRALSTTPLIPAPYRPTIDDFLVAAEYVIPQATGPQLDRLRGLLGYVGKLPASVEGTGGDGEGEGE